MYEPIKIEPRQKQDSILVNIPISKIHFEHPAKEKMLREAEAEHQVNVDALQSNVQEIVNGKNFGMTVNL